MLPRPSNGFIRAVSLNRKRVHQASTRLFRSQESPLWELRGALGAGVRRPRGRGSRRSPSGSGAGAPERRGVPGSEGAFLSAAVPCSLFPRLAVETPRWRWRFPAPRRGGVSFRRCLQIPSTSLLAAQRPSPHGAMRVLAAWGSPGLLCVHAEVGLTYLGGVLGAHGGTQTSWGTRAGGEGCLRWGSGGSG